MFFRENKKRQRQTEDHSSDSDHNNHQTEVSTKKRVPAWFDKNTSDQLKVDIDSGPSRLKKLKKEEGEKVVTGIEYQERLREQQQKIIGSSDLFGWAKKDQSQIDEGADLSGNQDQGAEEMDPIQKLLQSTTSIFASS